MFENGLEAAICNFLAEIRQNPSKQLCVPVAVKFVIKCEASEPRTDSPIRVDEVLAEALRDLYTICIFLLANESVAQIGRLFQSKRSISIAK